ncbi:MAG: DUF4412 domain-containing protein [Gemmatimonadales bacterium]
MPRSCLLVLLALPALAGRAAAQGFEGTITMTFSSAVGARQASEGSMKTATRGDRTVTTLMLASGPGVPQGGEVRTIADRKAKTLTTLTRMPPGVKMPPSMTGGVDVKGFVNVDTLSSMFDRRAGLDTHPDIRKLGTSQTIAGMRCDDYEIKEQNTTPVHACITTALGAFAFPLSGRGLMGGPGSATPGWAKAFGDKPGFPLKVWGSDGKLEMQVTAIDKTPVADSAFAIPQGYVAMPEIGRSGREALSRPRPE